MAAEEVHAPPSAAAAPLKRKVRASPRIAQMQRTFYFLRKNTLAMIGLGVILFFVFVALYSFFYPAPATTLQNYCGTYTGNGAPLTNTTGCISVCTSPPTLTPTCSPSYPTDQYDPSLIPPTVTLYPFHTGPLPLGSLTVLPGGNYFFNIYAGLVKGAPWSLFISASIVGSGAGIGLLLGAVAGFKGGVIDESIMRVTDIFLSIPGLLLVIVLLSVLGGTVVFNVGGVNYGSIIILLLAFIVTWWPLYTRIVRGQVLVTREQKYVEAARASGAKSGRIVLRHVIPNSVYPIFVQMSLDVGTIPLSIAAIVFLGFHIYPSPYFPEWGAISGLALSVSIIQPLITQCVGSGVTCPYFPWWQIFWPGAVLFAFAISVNFLSDGLRDALDPRLRR
ncbi:MAG TPA: ABC transporter permease [Thermoplasmata archaeon]|nr:ABC transporter permease [Thermoplasmata archaeon]